MQSKLSLLTTAAALAFGLTATALAGEPIGDGSSAKGGVTIMKDAAGNAPANAAGQTAPDEGSAMAPDPDDGGAAVQANPPASDEGGATAQGGSEDAGGTPAVPPVKEGKIPSPSSSY